VEDHVLKGYKTGLTNQARREQQRQEQMSELEDVKFLGKKVWQDSQMNLGGSLNANIDLARY
jgi:hypothetical protein